jgi:hypothetical protein
VKHILLNLGAAAMCLLIAWFDFSHRLQVAGVMMVMVAMVNLAVVVHLFRRGFHRR